MTLSKYIGGFLVSSCLLVPAWAAAQIYDGAVVGFQDDFSVQATVGFKIPLGATNRQKLKHQPRLDFGLDLARTSSQSQTGQWRQKRVNLLDVGVYGTNDFSLRLSGQELYGPTFSTIFADETDEKSPEGEVSKGGSNKTLYWVVGGVTVLAVGGALFTVMEIENGLRDIGE